MGETGTELISILYSLVLGLSLMFLDKNLLKSIVFGFFYFCEIYSSFFETLCYPILSMLILSLASVRNYLASFGVYGALANDGCERKLT